MSITRSIATATATALLALPSAAIAVGPPASPGADHRPAGAKSAPGHDAPASAKAKAYGKHCQGKSKKHVAGEKGTPFSRCVVAAKKKLADQPA